MFSRYYRLPSRQNLCKWFKYPLLNSLGSRYTSGGRCTIARVNTHVCHPADKCSGFYWTVILAIYKSPDLSQIGLLFSSWCIDHRPSETSSEQLLDIISQELINGAIGQWSKRLLLVVHSHGGNTKHCFCQFCNLFMLQTISVMNCIEMLSVLMFIE